MPRGVDLNLDEFDLSAPAEVESKMTSSDACLPIGNDFFKSIFSDSTSDFKEEDKNLLRAIFNPSLCDRSDEDGEGGVSSGKAPKPSLPSASDPLDRKSVV